MKINWFKWLWVITLAIAVWLLWQSCHQKVIEKPGITNTVEVVKKDEAAMKQVADSFNLILHSKNIAILVEQGKYENLLAEYLNQQNDIGNVLTEPVPDTCRAIVANLTGKFNKLKSTSAEKDAACNQTIADLELVRQTQNDFIKEKDASYKKLRANFDTAVSIAKALKPRNQVYVGVSANVYPVLGYGIDLGIKLKSGLMIETRALQMNGKTYGQLSFKKVISFRR